MNLANTSNNVLDLSKKELLERTSQFIFSTGLNDGASRLCKANMKYGLAQMQVIQEKYGLEPNATFISSPDETISRNNFRWNSGLGYGGRINWGNGKEKLIFLNMKPNCCGILVGGLSKPPDPFDIIQEIDKIKSMELYHDNILINWDFGVSNHFINCFETKTLSDIDFPPYMFIIHGSAPEFRTDLYGIGLYVDQSPILKQMAIEETTPFGMQYILTDSKAKEYMKFHLKALKFSKIKRELIAKQIFGNDFHVICNQPHQFLKDYNNMYLGCCCTDTSCELVENDIFPTVLRADIACYLFQGKRNLSEQVIKTLKFKETAEKLGLMDLLKNANILAHGGGYSFPDIKRVQKVLEYKDQRYFVCELREDTNKLKIVRNVKELQFEYRGRDVILKSLQLDLGDIIARLNPIFSLKL
ncbi:MAG: hypothetical protein ACTSPN_00025 [Promethearchaeota archaeon]